MNNVKYKTGYAKAEEMLASEAFKQFVKSQIHDLDHDTYVGFIDGFCDCLDLQLYDLEHEIGQTK